METLGVDTIEALADRGYVKFENIEACEAAVTGPGRIAVDPAGGDLGTPPNGAIQLARFTCAVSNNQSFAISIPNKCLGQTRRRGVSRGSPPR